MEERHLYFAYGSNIPTSHMVEGRTPSATNPRKAVMTDWVLQFNGCADVRPSAGDRVEGVVWEVNEADLRRLDAYEGCARDPWGDGGFYRRVRTVVDTVDGPVAAIVYVMNSGHDRLGTPSEYYFNIIKRGYQEFGLDLSLLSHALEDCALRLGEANVGKMKADGPKRWIPIDAETSDERRARLAKPKTNRRQRRKEARRLEEQSRLAKRRLNLAVHAPGSSAWDDPAESSDRRAARIYLLDEGMLDYEAEQVLEEVDAWADECGRDAVFEDYMRAGSTPSHQVMSLEDLYELERKERAWAS